MTYKEARDKILRQARPKFYLHYTICIGHGDRDKLVPLAAQDELSATEEARIVLRDSGGRDGTLLSFVDDIHPRTDPKVDWDCT